jgi:hypothetical protein
VINEASSLCEDLIESETDVFHSLKKETSKNGRTKSLAKGGKKKGTVGIEVRRSSRLKKKVSTHERLHLEW